MEDRTERVTRYAARDVAVRGGLLRVGIWDCDQADVPPHTTVLAIHGVTASHKAWPLVAERVTSRPGNRLIAPDLRGRGRSAGLPGPWGMPTHAADLAAVLDAFEVEKAIVIGHSMGAFVAVVFAHLYPSRTAELVLVDGGIPLPPPPGLSAEESLNVTLGPAAARLRMTFSSRAAYLDFWREHPAFGPDWSQAVESYLGYDLAGEEPHLRSSVRYDAIAADALELSGGSLLAAWHDLPDETIFLRAPLGLFAEPPGLYSRQDVEAWASRYPRLRWCEVGGVNHYTITLSERGADAVADAIRTANT
jgi:lipase